MLERGNRREVEGVVIGTKMAKTIVVHVSQRFRHPFYKKYISRSKKYYAHDEKQLASEGDWVRITEGRPISKLKRWQLKEVIKKAAQ